MYATVTRRARGSGRIVGPEQRIDVITTLKAMTIWPAYHHFEEKTKGSLAPGKLADFGILSKDPTVVEPTTIADIKVTETVKEGKTIFRLEPGSKAEAPASIMPLSSRRWPAGAMRRARMITAPTMDARQTPCCGWSPQWQRARQRA